VDVEAPDGSLARLPLADLPIEVTSLLPEHAERTTPFGARAAPPAARAAGDALGPALAGALTALALVGLLALARRRRRSEPAAPAREAPGPPPWERAHDEIEAARARAAGDPFGAAHALARALRRYTSRRFEPSVAALTSEEIAAREAPFAARSRWPQLVALLRRLDEQRFLPESDARAAALAERLPALCAEARAFVAGSTPPGAAAAKAPAADAAAASLPAQGPAA
jgi:hypothetical protein